MEKYSGWEYLLIDVANHYGLDKLLFEERIDWANQNLHHLENLAKDAESEPLYLKGVQAIRNAMKGEPIGHVIGLDAVCSGIQVMSALTGCVKGSEATGLINTGIRPDAYSETTDVMNQLLGGGVTVSRDDSKKALMTSYYGSKAKPREIFGEDTPELAAFYQAAYTVAPGAWELLQDLLASWQPYALEHSWKLPDGFDAHVKVMEQQTTRIKVDELNNASFSYTYYENVGAPTGRANVANVVHSVDGYILRCIQRRCNYERAMVEHAAGLIQITLLERSLNMTHTWIPRSTSKLGYYVEQYERSGMADVIILPYLTSDNVCGLSTKHLQALAGIVNHMLTYQPFEVITIHDEFKVHPNNANHLRQQYINIFAELAESRLLDDLLSQIHGVPGSFTKLSKDLGSKIRGSEYALS